MKKVLVYLIVFLKLNSSANAGDSKLIESAMFQSVVANKYLASNIGFTIYNKPVVQSLLSLGLKGGFHIDLWNSTPIEKFNQNLGTEQDFGLGWNGLPTLFGASPSSDTILDIGASYFDEPGLMSFGPEDIYYAYVKLSARAKKTTFWVMYEDYVVMPGSLDSGGYHFSLGLDKDRIVLDDWAGMTVSFAGVYDTGAFGFNSGIFFRGTVEFDWEITKEFRIIFPHFDYCMPVTARDHPSDLVITGGFGWKF